MPSKRHKRAIPARPNSEAVKDGGLTRSSDEVSVIEMAMGLANLLALVNFKEDEPKRKDELDEPYDARESRTVL
jgi:hypothetical protein